MCPKTSKTTPLLLIGGIVFVIILVAITGVTLINNINLSNIIRLNEKVASDSVSANDNQIKELNYVNNHPKNLLAKLPDATPTNNEANEAGDSRSLEQIRHEMSSVVPEPKLSAVIWRDGQKSQFLDEPMKSPTLALPLGGATVTPGGEAVSLIDYEKRAQIVKVSYAGWVYVCPGGGGGGRRGLSSNCVSISNVGPLGACHGPKAMWQLLMPHGLTQACGMPAQGWVIHLP